MSLASAAAGFLFGVIACAWLLGAWLQAHPRPALFLPAVTSTQQGGTRLVSFADRPHVVLRCDPTECAWGWK